MLPPRLTDRLHALTQSLEARPDALGLLALGSIGEENERADAWSDLDFFVFVQPGAKRAYLESLDWLSAAHPLVWAFANTGDGYKALMADGLLCEFAVFEPNEIAGIPYSPGRWVWRRGDALPESWRRSSQPMPTAQSIDWLVGEALGNLLVGLQRFHRGERIAAMRMVQVYALDRLMEIIDLREAGIASAPRDPFNAYRRFEFRHPDCAALVAACAAGINATPQAALALLNALREIAELPTPVVTQIEWFATRAGLISA